MPPSGTNINEEEKKNGYDRSGSAADNGRIPATEEHKYLVLTGIPLIQVRRIFTASGARKTINLHG